VVAGLLLTLFTFYPGLLSYDSANQLFQGRRGTFNDWHPPVMSWIWGWIDRVVRGPAGMLILHNVLFWSGLGVWTAWITPGWRAPARSLVILAMGFFPSIFMLLSTIWKDVAMAAWLLFAAGWLAMAERKGSLRALSLSLVGMWCALAMRHNAVFAVLPLMLVAGGVLFNRMYPDSNRPARHRRMLSAVLGLLLLGVSLLSTTLAGRLLTGFQTTYAGQTILVHDLLAISVHANQILVPDYVTLPQQVTLADLQAINATQFPVVCLYSGCGVSELRIKTYATPDLHAQTIRVWARAVLSHPDAYLLHRLQEFKRQFAIGGGTVCLPYITENDQVALAAFGIDAESMGPPRPQPRVTRAVLLAAERLQNTLFFRGWVYLAFLLVVPALALLPRVGARRAPTVVLAVGGSGLLYGLSYFAISTTCDFRMHYWTVVSAVACAPAVLGWLLPSREKRMPTGSVAGSDSGGRWPATP
jgi:hypothetical protein